MAYNFGKNHQNNGKANAKFNEEESKIDNQLVARCTENDTTSFEELYHRHYRRVYCLCLRMTSNIADAEDIAHDVFIQLHRNITSFRGESTFASWLHRITVNQVLMRFRKRSTRSELTTDDGEMPDVVVPNTGDPTNMPIVDNIALSTAIAKLPNGYRKVFLLHDVEGYEHEEIAKILGISVGTSKSQLHKARMKLRGIIVERAGEAAAKKETKRNNVIKPSFVEALFEETELLAA